MFHLNLLLLYLYHKTTSTELFSLELKNVKVLDPYQKNGQNRQHGTSQNCYDSSIPTYLEEKKFYRLRVCYSKTIGTVVTLVTFSMLKHLKF